MLLGPNQVRRWGTILVGYELHITRKAEWFEKGGPSIELDEWIAYLAADDEFEVANFAEASIPGGDRVRIESEGLAVWYAYSGHEPAGNKAWFMYYEDRIVVKNPDQEIRRKMYRVAMRLGAHVQGDEGELYGEDGEQVGASVEPGPKSASARPWWKFWR